MNYGDFSATADAEQTAMSCESTTIPILPVRFSLLPYDLDNVVKPTSIDNPGSYLVRTLRRGFVYVYVEDPQNDEVATDRLGDRNWHIFRFDTNNKDVNGTYVPENTDGYIRADFKFSKYKWTKATADGNWVYDESVPPSSTIFVPCWASKVWLAYSEYRWPAAYFKECNDPSVRAQLMQPVNLRGTNKWAAKLAKADQIVEEFKPDSQRASRQVVTQLELSQVKLAAQRAPQRSHEQAALVALFDPLGDIKDAQFRISQMGQYISNVTEAYKYPLTIGNFCTALKSEVDERDGFLDKYVGNKPAFRKGWEEKHLEIKNNILNAQAEIKDIIIYINETVADFDPYSIGRMFHLADEYSKDVEVCTFVSNIFGT
ncbi:toxin VasX, partial [Thalassospira sp. TSL5-1]|uniref:toxin VasX n=1 Tax=Thalassospira sp. TSL5-1 TaxID=1544451 RepID=UPI00096035E4